MNSNCATFQKKLSTESLHWWAWHLPDMCCYYFGFFFTIIILKLVNKAICLKIWPYNFKMQNLKRILS